MTLPQYNTLTQQSTTMDLNKSIPQPFADFCTRAKLSQTESESTSADTYYIKYHQSVACIIDAQTTELSGQIIIKSFTAFKGAHITVTSLQEVCQCTLRILKKLTDHFMQLYHLSRTAQRKDRKPCVHN